MSGHFGKPGSVGSLVDKDEGLAALGCVLLREMGMTPFEAADETGLSVMEIHALTSRNRLPQRRGGEDIDTSKVPA